MSPGRSRDVHVGHLNVQKPRHIWRGFFIGRQTFWRLGSIDELQLPCDMEPTVRKLQPQPQPQPFPTTAVPIRITRYQGSGTAGAGPLGCRHRSRG